jgi:hypothetical protein
MSQDRPSPLPSRYSIVSSRAGSLPACLNVTDDSEPSVWFSLEGLSLRTKVAHDETALFLSNFHRTACWGARLACRSRPLHQRCIRE